MRSGNQLYSMTRKIFLFGMIFCLQVNSAWAEGLTKAETKYTCMVNNTVFSKDQIPTVVDGKTYYGCCEMCAGKLAKNAAIRKAFDPVSGKGVDKATAVIGRDKEGKAYYFESEKNLMAFSPEAK